MEGPKDLSEARETWSADRGKVWEGEGGRSLSPLGGKNIQNSTSKVRILQTEMVLFAVSARLSIRHYIIATYMGLESRQIQYALTH